MAARNKGTLIICGLFLHVIVCVTIPVSENRFSAKGSIHHVVQSDAPPPPTDIDFNDDDRRVFHLSVPPREQGGKDGGGTASTPPVDPYDANPRLGIVTFVENGQNKIGKQNGTNEHRQNAGGSHTRGMYSGSYGGMPAESDPHSSRTDSNSPRRNGPPSANRGRKPTHRGPSDGASDVFYGSYFNINDKDNLGPVSIITNPRPGDTSSGSREKSPPASRQGSSREESRGAGFRTKMSKTGIRSNQADSRGARPENIEREDSDEAQPGEAKVSRKNSNVADSDPRGYFEEGLYPGRDVPYPGRDRSFRGREGPYPGGERPYQGEEEGPYPGGERPFLGRDEPYSGREGPFPGREGPFPGRDGPYPGMERPYPGGERPYPGGERPFPGREEPYPGREGPFPGREGPFPGRDGPYLGGEGPYPGKDGPYPGGEGPYPGRDGPYPGGEELYPGGKRPYQGGEGPFPGREEPYPGREEPFLAREGPHSNREGPYPVGERHFSGGPPPGDERGPHFQGGLPEQRPYFRDKEQPVGGGPREGPYPIDEETYRGKPYGQGGQRPDDRTRYSGKGITVNDRRDREQHPGDERGSHREPARRPDDRARYPPEGERPPFYGGPPGDRENGFETILGGHNPDEDGKDPLDGYAYDGPRNNVHQGSVYPGRDSPQYGDSYDIGGSSGRGRDGYREDRRGGSGYTDPYKGGSSRGYVDYTGNHVGKVTGINVECKHGDYTKSMHITITFDGVFDGKVYAKGYYDIPHCSAYGTGADYVTLVLPLDGCGMEEITHDFGASSRGDDYHGYGVSYSTTIIVMFQTYTGVLEEWDKVFSVKCDNDKLPEKVLKFGLEVPDVHATVVPTYKAKIPDVYLSVVGGKDMYGPPTTSLYVGERAALLIIAHDTSYYDIKVVNCYAHDGKNRHKILLIDNNGCPAAQKIIGAVQKDTDQPGYGKSAYYAYFKAFKFPDNNNVYFQCSVRICHQQCDVHSCRDKYGGSGYGSDRRNDGYGNDVYGGGGGGGYGEDDRYGYGSDSGGYADILYRRKRNVEDLHHGLPEFWNGTVLFGNHSDDSAANLTGVVEDEREVSRGITIVMPGEEEAEITELKAHNRWPAEVTGVCVDRVALYGAAAGAGSVIVILIVATVIFYSRLNTLRNMQHRKQAEDRILEKKHRRMQR